METGLRTGVRQRDSLSLLLVLDKIVKLWEKTQKGVLVGKVRMKCLVFADNLTITTVPPEKPEKRTQIRAIEELRQITAKTRLQISYEKTQFMSNLKLPTLNTKYIWNSTQNTIF